MLKININERISWNDYFNHPFFKEDNFDLPHFEFICQKHSKEIYYYCKNCKKNICNICLKEHSSHNIISFNKIGLNNNEIERIENIFNNIDNQINKIKKDIKDLLLKIKLIKENNSIYDNDINNNYKELYF